MGASGAKLNNHLLDENSVHCNRSGRQIKLLYYHWLGAISSAPTTSTGIITTASSSITSRIRIRINSSSSRKYWSGGDWQKVRKNHGEKWRSNDIGVPRVMNPCVSQKSFMSISDLNPFNNTEQRVFHRSFFRLYLFKVAAYNTHTHTKCLNAI